MQSRDREPQFRVCVFASSSDYASPQLKRIAQRMGQHLARRGHVVVFGGTAQGCMGHLATGAIQERGTLVGILPRSLQHLAFAQLSKSEITEDLYARQRSFERSGDAFVALPGGVGTLAELLSLLNAKLIEQHDKPIILLNVRNEWDVFLELLESIIRKRLVQPSIRDAFVVATNVSAALRLVDRAFLAHTEAVLRESQDPLTIAPQSKKP